MIVGDNLYTVSNEEILEYLEESFKKKVTDEFYVSDLVKKTDGSWGIVLTKRLIPKKEKTK